MNFHTALVNDFYLPTDFAEQLESYYILHWEVQYVRKMLIKEKDIIVHREVSYTPIFEIVDWQSLHPRDVLKLSFRKPYYEDAIPNYVLIKKLGT